MGDGAGTIQDPDDPDRVFVRVHGLQNSVARVFNKKVPTNRPDLQILIGATREQPHLVQVLSVNWSALPDWDGATMLPLHGPEHEFGGPDPIYIQKRAIIPMRATAQRPATMVLNVAADFYPWDDGFNYWPGGTTEDLSGRVPGAGLARFVTIYVDGAANALGYVNGDTKQVTFPLGIDMIPEPPEGSVPICAVRLYNGMPAIVEDDVYDLRILIAPMGGSLAPAQHGLDPVEGRHTGTLDTSHLEARIACTGAM